jgi:hypothetical protein
MGGVDADHVNFGVDECLRSVQAVASDADCGRDAESSV